VSKIYSYDEVYKASLEYFGGEELAAKIFTGKYALSNNNNEYLELTPKDMFRRLAKELARIESSKFKDPMTEDEIYFYLDDFKFLIPQGSVLYGVGNERYVTLSNCYVLESPLDSYPGIHLTDQQLTAVAKRRGGTGIDISKIRPAGAITQNSSQTSTGIGPFMERFSNSTREVGQANRRGATMITISCHHPEVLTFAQIKQDLTKVTGANISIRLTDEFLKAVENKEKYELRWPVDSSTPKISKLVDANEIWNEIVKCAHNTGEPGLIFWDNIKREAPSEHYERFKIASCNPCQAKWATVLTKKGLLPIDSVQVGQEIWSENGWTKVIRKEYTGYNEIFCFRTSSGCFNGTEQHTIVSNGTKKYIAETDTIDILRGYECKNNGFDAQAVMDGLVIGDGSKHKCSNNLVYLCIGTDDYDYLTDELVAPLIKKKRPGLADTAYEIHTTITPEELPKTFDRFIPARYKFAEPYILRSFLRGLYSANGSVVDGRATLCASSRKIVDDVQIMLSSIGIKSYVTVNGPFESKFSNGTYLCKRTYTLNITKDAPVFFKLIGYIQKYKNIKLEGYINNKKSSKKDKISYDIIEKNFVGVQETVEIEVDNISNTYWSDGLNISNCSEITMGETDACRLLLLNTLSYVKNPFTDNSYFDFELFYNHAQIAQRTMDNIVDLETECIERILNKIKTDEEPEEVKFYEYRLWEKIKWVCENGRRTGTGITALGDTIAALNMKYGSNESIELVDKIYKTLKFGAYRSSVDMAEELGPFSVWDKNSEKDNLFLNRIKYEKLDFGGLNIDGNRLYEDMQKYGRRNIALLTTSPAGTVSNLANVGKIQDKEVFGTTSGIEPAFMLSYKRRRKITHNESNSKVDFIDSTGDKWEEFDVYHPSVKLWKEISGNNNIEQSPWWSACAEDLDWQNRVLLQATATKHLDHSCSSTINLPEDVTVEKVKEIYEAAWKLGCKGITVYRKNSRTGVLIDKETKPKSISKVDAPKRPKVLECDVHHLSVVGFWFTVIVGKLNGLPYEVLAVYDKDIKIPKRITSGTVEKVKRGHYNLISGDYVLENVSQFCLNDEEAITRLISTGLRHGADISFIVAQLLKTKGHLQSFSKAVARALKNYVPDNTKVVGTECPECKTDSLVFSEGCFRCNQCGFSKCG